MENIFSESLSNIFLLPLEWPPDEDGEHEEDVGRNTQTSWARGVTQTIHWQHHYRCAPRRDNANMPTLSCLDSTMTASVIVLQKGPSEGS